MLAYAGQLVPVALVDGAGNAQRRQIVDVLNPDGSAATLYSDSARTPLTGSAASDEIGNVKGLFAEPGVYRLRFIVRGVTYETDTIAMIDPREITDLHTLVTGVQSTVSAETAARAAADSAEISARAAADSAEQAARIAADASEAASRASGDTNEAALRAAADTAETNARTAADSAETAARAALAATEAADAAAAATATGNEATARAAAVTAEQNRALAAEAANSAAITANTTAIGLRGIVVNHGAVASTARPSSALPVAWYGTVAPTNAATNDTWDDQVNDLRKRWNGTAWVAAGTGTYQSVDAPARTPSHPTPVRPTPAVVVSTFQTGHGWTISTAAGTYDAAATNLNDTTDFVLGSQAAVVATATDGSLARLDSPVGSAIDTTSSFVRLLVKIENPSQIGTLLFYAGDSAFSNYSSVSLNTNETRTGASYIKDGEWTWITFNLTDASVTGTGGRTSVARYRFAVSSLTGQQVKFHVGAVQFVKISPTFPRGVVSFTFDDGRSSPFTNAKPKLDALGWRATAYPIIEKIAPTTGGAYLTLAQLKQLRDYSGWEIGSHAFTSADHDAGFDTLTAAQVEADILAERQWLYANGLGRGEGFAWPLGTFTKTVADAAARLVAYGRLNTTATVDETWPPENHMRVRSYAIGPSTSLALAKGYVDRVKSSGGWLCFTFHEITTAGTESLAWSTANFSDLCDYIAAQGVAVLPVLDVIKKGAEELTTGAPVGFDTLFVNNHLSAGETTFPRYFINGGASTSSGTMMLSYFTAEQTETVTQVAVSTDSVAAAATPTLCRVGVYSVDASGNGTLVASSANDTTLFAAANTKYTATLSASFSKVAGQRYAVAVLVVSATTMPKMAGIALGGASSFYNNDTPRLVGLVTSLADLPGTFSGGGLNNGSKIAVFAELLR